MRSRCEIEEEATGVTIRIRPERSVLDAVVWPLTIAVVAPLIIANDLGWAGLLLWAMLSYLVWRFFWNLFGFEEIACTLDAVTITRRLWFWRKMRRCGNSNIDWIAYHPQAYRSPPGIGILLKDHVMPFGVAYDLGLNDAETVLSAIKKNAPWLGPRVRGTADTSFYKPA
jgi:hypothetical protein